MLQGSLCALVTPFSDGTVDGAAYEKFVDWHHRRIPHFKS